MGQHKKQRTEKLINAVNNRYYAEIASNDIEQFKFDKLVAAGVIVEGELSEKEKMTDGY